MVFFGNIQFVLIAVVGGLRISSGAISVGDMQAMMQYARQFSMPLTQLASMTATVKPRSPRSERVVELFDAPDQSPDDESSALPTPVMRGQVVFDDVHFSYVPERPLIEGLDLVAEPGQTIAIVGPTGAGKTTIVNLLMRFYELDSAGSRSTAATSRTSCSTLRSRSAWCSRTRGCSVARSATTSPTETRTRPRSRSSRRCASHLRGPLRALPPRRLRHRGRRRR